MSKTKKIILIILFCILLFGVSFAIPVRINTEYRNEKESDPAVVETYYYNIYNYLLWKK